MSAEINLVVTIAGFVLTIGAWFVSYGRLSQKIEDLTGPDGRITKLEKYATELYIRTDKSAQFEAGQSVTNQNSAAQYARIEKKLEIIEELLRNGRN